MINEKDIRGYSISEVLYKGNRNVVYRAVREEDGQQVVLKTLLNAYPGPAEIAQLTREFNFLKSTEIPGINKVFDLLDFKNRPVIVMEYFGGVPLSQYLKKHPGGLVQSLEIAIHITDVLGSIHACNIMHKDINPDNILIHEKTGEIRIIDFGIATKLSLERTSVRNPHVLEGTLRYMSPEQTGRMNRSTDYRTDLYSLGVTLYELLTGTLPFQSEDAMELVHCHIARKAAPPSNIKPEIPRIVSDIVLKLMAKTAEDRYQSTSGLKYDLEQCLNHLKAHSLIPVFTLGQKDAYTKFKVPERLYGREREIDALMRSFDEVENGGCNLLLISGTSGIGKTALVNEIHKPTIRKKGYFISGKFDQFKSNIPFNAFALAFSELVKHLVSEPRQKLEKIKAELSEALGLNASVLMDLVPGFEHIIDSHQPAQELNLAESQHRFFFTLIEFIRVFAKKEHPLTIFVDDLQWSDDSSTTLIKELLTREIPYLFIIGAYRNSEVSEGHPLRLTIEEIKKTKRIHEIQLDALDEKNINQLIADSLLSSREETRELASIVFKRTAGNPFYVNELLKTIHNDGLIRFNHHLGKWTWDIANIATLDIAGNVVDFMTKKLKELPEDCLLLLEIAACLGNIFDLKTLSLIARKTAAETASVLWPAVEEEIIVPLNEEYRLVIDDEDFGVAYKFLHDRIQQTAYLLIDDNKRKALHLKIGKELYQDATEAQKNETLIELVRHFNEGRELISDPAQRDILIELNLRAGIKAQSAVAYQSALSYFKTGIEQLPESCWQTHYPQTFDLYAGYAQNAYHAQDIATAEESIGLLLSKARTKLEKVKVISLKLRQYTTLGKAEEAIQAGIEGLALLGYKLPANPGAPTVLKEVLLAKWNLGKRKPMDLLDGPVLQDPEKKAAARLLTDIGPSAFVLGNDNLYGLTSLKVVNLSLLYGNCPESSFAYTAFGTVLKEAFGDLQAAEDFGQLALAINEKLGDIEYRCRVIAAYGVLMHHFNHHWNNTSDWFKRGIAAGYLSGDLFFLAYCATNCTFWNPALDLPASLEEQQKYLKVVAETGYKDALNSGILRLQETKNLMGLTHHRLTLSDDLFEEEKCLGEMTQRKYSSGIGMYHIGKARIFLYYEEYEKAYEAIREADKYVKSLVSLINLTYLCQIAFFACAGYLREGKNPPESRLKKRMKRELSQMRKWAKYNHVNFLHRQLLMEAELASLENHPARAASLYEKAINTANQHAWPEDEAFANELTGKFYAKNGLHKAASGYLKEAFYLYQKWGAAGKTGCLEETYPQIFAQKKTTGTLSLKKTQLTTGSIREGDSIQVLDVATIVKSSQAISEEIELKSLLEKMMKIIMMNAGAENGTLLLEHEGRLYVQAAATGDEVTSMQNIPLRDCKNLSKTVVNYVSNIKEAVVLDDACNEGDFRNGEYIRENQIKSILCSPVVFMNKLFGVVYLENNVSTGAFTEERLRILQLLSSQMAISIQNAMLYASLEHKVEERTTELRLEKQKSDDLLHNILPEEVADELKANGSSEARLFQHTTVLISDFVNFTSFSETLTPKDLIEELNFYFTAFDEIMERHGLEKIKTIGDAYLAVCGIPNENENHAINSIKAAHEILTVVKKRKEEGGGLFDVRIGVSSGPVVAGIVGVKKFAYDIWGDTVNTAARMESASEAGKINISATTYELVKNDFNCVSRGKIQAKNKGMIEMYFVGDAK